MYYFVLFKASWCGHCQDFQMTQLPAISEYIDNHKKFVKMIIFDADKDSKVIDKEDIEGFPTLRLYQGSDKNPLQKRLVEFQRRDAQHIKNVLAGLEKKVGGKVEHFTPNKTVSYSSYYQNYNGKINQQSQGVVCENGVCKRVNRIVDEHGRVKQSNDVVPYNDYANGLRSYYDASLEIRNHF